jgi:hypothetical protein
LTDVATNEPLEARAGLNWRWDRNDLSADYPAGTWTLTYYFKNAGANFSFAAVANGLFFSVSRTAAQTTPLVAGKYDWVAVVSDGTNKYEVDNGRLNLLADYTAAVSIDSRTHARKVLEAIEAVLEGRASKDQEEYTIGSRSLKRTPIVDLIKLRQTYRNEVASEDAAERLDNGLGGTAKIQVRL